MIIEYIRPKTLDEVLKYISKPNTRPMGGGTVLCQPSDETFSAIDLQSLGLNKILKNGNSLEIGATATLQSLAESAHTGPALISALKVDAPINVRNQRSVAGSLLTCDGRSPFAAVMLGLDANLILAGAKEKRSSVDKSIRYGNLLPYRNEEIKGKLILRIDIPLNASVAFEMVARTPMDKPIICIALAHWPSGRTRLAVGGWGESPILAFDGNESGGLQEAAKNACSESTNEWASADYRSEMAAILVQRCVESLHISSQKS